MKDSAKKAVDKLNPEDLFTIEKLDITDFKKLTRDELQLKIVDAVKSYSQFTQLPNVIVMRTDQYDLLETDVEMQKMYNSAEQMYSTIDPKTFEILNLMEVKVINAPTPEQLDEGL